MSFDARTLLIVGGFLCWILAAAIEFQAVRPHGSRVAPDAWTLGLLVKGMGLNLISQRGLVADVWTISLAHALLLASLLLFYVALQRLRGAVTSWLTIAAMPVAVAILLPIVGFSREAFPARVLVIMAAWLFGFSLSCWSAAQIARAGYLAGASLILGSNAIMAVLAIAFAVAVHAQEVTGVFGGSGVQLAFYATSDVCILLGSFGYMDILRTARSEKRKFGDSSQSGDASQPDSLTGLFSGPTFRKLGIAELERAGREGHPVCVAAIQIDGFSAVLALRGQVVADDALRRVAAIILREIRVYDFAGRHSADLFGVLMPDVPLASGLDVAERIRVMVESDAANQTPGGLRLRISVGLCETHDPKQEHDELFAAAIACLERAQEEGGNRVVAPQTV